MVTILNSLVVNPLSNGTKDNAIDFLIHQKKVNDFLRKMESKNIEVVWLNSSVVHDGFLYLSITTIVSVQ